MTNFLLKRPLLDDRGQRARTESTLPTTLGETVGTLFDEPKFTERLSERADIAAKERGPVIPESYDSDEPFAFNDKPEFGPFTGRKFTVDELNQRYAHLGLTFDREMGAEAAEALVQLKREEIVRNNILQRGPKGMLPLAVQFGVGVLAQAMDPIELGSVFVPVLGEARAAAIIARFGAIRGRTLVGAAEGLGGSVVFEPGYMYVSQELQLDYTMSDALLNVFLGTALGGTIGAGVGTIKELRPALRLTEDMEIPLQLKEEWEVPLQLEFDQQIALKLTPEMRAELFYTSKGDVTLEMTPDMIARIKDDPNLPFTLRITEGYRAPLLLDFDQQVPLELTGKMMVKQGDTRETLDLTPFLVKDQQQAGDAMRTALAQTAEGKTVDVTPITNSESARLAGEMDRLFKEETGARLEVMRKREEMKKVENLLKRAKTKKTAEKHTKRIRELLDEIHAEEIREVEIGKEWRQANVAYHKALAEESTRLAETESAPSRDGLYDEAKIEAVERELDAVPAEKLAEDLEKPVETATEAAPQIPGAAPPATGPRFHGTSSKITALQPNTYSTLNIYGQGFYTTDSFDRAGGYTKKGKGKEPTIYGVTERPGVVLYDMEAPLTPEILVEARKVFGDLYPAKIDDTGEAPKNLREMYDEVRARSAAEFFSADDVQDMFESMRVFLEKKGFRGFRHIGGLRTKNPAHDVRIYWQPDADVTVTESGVKKGEIKESPPAPAQADAPAPAKTEFDAQIESLRAAGLLDEQDEADLRAVLEQDKATDAAIRVTNELKTCMRN